MAFEIIPAIDLLDNKVVRLSQGDYEKVDHYTSYTPGEWAKRFEDHGATRIHVVDLNGAKEGKSINLDAIRDIRRAVSCKVQVGGGIRQIASIDTLVSEGIDWVILGSLLVKQFALAATIIENYPNKIIAGLDAHNMNLAIEGWIQKSNVSIFSLIEALRPLPIAGIIYTDISKDGMLSGPNFTALESIANNAHCPLIASGGVGTLEHIAQLKSLHAKGVTGCIVGKAILSEKISLQDIYKNT